MQLDQLTRQIQTDLEIGNGALERALASLREIAANQLYRPDHETFPAYIYAELDLSNLAGRAIKREIEDLLVDQGASMRGAAAALGLDEKTVRRHQSQRSTDAAGAASVDQGRVLARDGVERPRTHRRRDGQGVVSEPPTRPTGRTVEYGFRLAGMSRTWRDMIRETGSRTDDLRGDWLRIVAEIQEALNEIIEEIGSEGLTDALERMLQGE